MNAPAPKPSFEDPRPPALNRRAPGPLRFTVEDVFRMQEAGLLDDDQPYELIYGEIVVLAPKKNEHEIAKSQLMRWLARKLDDDKVLAIESSLFLGFNLFVDPDIMVYRRGLKPEEVRGKDALLVVEVSAESLSRDLRDKAAIYAEHLVPEYWVVDAVRRRTTVHRRPEPKGYADVQTFEADALLTPLHAPEAAVRLADLN